MKHRFFSILILVFLFAFPFFIFASRIDELRAKIEEYNAQISEIEKEIEEYQKQIDKASKEAKTLKNQISQLEATIKKLKADIKLTENKIAATNFIIEELLLNIKSKEEEIKNSKIVLAETIRRIDETESQSLVEILLAHNNFSDFFSDLERMKEFQNTVNINLQQLKTLKNDFQNQEREKETEKKNLENLNLKLADQKLLLEMQKNQKNNLLKETKNKESTYKKLLADRSAKQQALEEEIQTIEEQIRIEIDPSSLPLARSGVLLWPIDKPIITQYFGNTPFATLNPQVYGGKGHNGIDLRASIGTPVKAAESGVVVDTGNTDNYCPGVSYGKWILIKHNNNLSTLYSHLSLIKVAAGENVTAGQIIGYSGDTGYVTGPHLHFTVFATPAVEIGSLKSRICGTTMKLPLAPYNGYLNPLSYL